MNTKTAVMEQTRRVAPSTRRVTPLYREQLLSLTEAGRGMGMTDWSVQPPADFAVRTAAGTRKSCWE